ncbi:MAG: hypothetical protein R3F49_08920, partial [Planctomycetota bacterium]
DALEPRAEDARVQARYEAQLALELDAAARLFGPQVVRSIALTGGDPYLRTGSDLALVFECAEPDAFEAFLFARIDARARARGVTFGERSVGAVSLRGAADAARDLSSWVARDGNVIVVSNSARLAARLIEVKRGAEPALAALPEYRHFRVRYPRGTADEVAFIVLSDGAIRRWCGPRWRIASARRVRAGGVLAEAAAALAAQRLGLEPSSALNLAAAIPDFGALAIDDAGPRSERYGTARFLTPIAELDFAYVTPEERDGYEAWRWSYERQWSTVFDPIAAQLSLSDDRMTVDLSVLPIAVRSDYREVVDIAGAARIAAGDGDPHATALAHAVLALDRDAAFIRQLEGILGSVVPGLERPLGWIGDHAAVWLDADAALMDAARESEDRDTFLEEHGFELPVGVLVAVRDPLRLAAFLGAVKALIEAAAPGVMRWETREVTTPSGAQRSYVAIEPQEGGGWDETPSLYYGIVPGRFIGSLREDVVLQALERAAVSRGAGEASEADVTEAARPWLGESLGVRFEEGFKDILALGLIEHEVSAALRRRAFGALPILNELRQVAPDEDPVALQVQLFGTTVRCPGGGELVWNADLGTYESTVFGCPARPLAADALPAALSAVRRLSLGLTFDRLDERTHGLRARAEVVR